MATDSAQEQAGQWAAFISYRRQTVRDGLDDAQSDAKGAVEEAVRTLAQQALAQTQLISSDAIASITAMISALDAKIEGQVNAIVNAPEFSAVHELWMDLHELTQRPAVRAHWKIFLERKDEGVTALAPSNEDALLRTIAYELLMCSIETKESVERLRVMQDDADALIAQLSGGVAP